MGRKTKQHTKRVINPASVVRTYRYSFNNKQEDRHYDTIDTALHQAVSDLETEVAVPISILADGEVFLDQDQIADEWEKKYL
jgi:hypothetical protein